MRITKQMTINYYYLSHSTGIDVFSKFLAQDNDFPAF